MNGENIVVAGITALLTMAGIVMLRYEWRRQEEPTQQDSFWRFPKWLWCYGAAMLVIQVAVSCLLLEWYPDNTASMVLKRTGLLVLIWQAAAIDWKYQKIPNDIIVAGVAWRIIMLIPEWILDRDQLVPNLMLEGIALAGIIVIVLICLVLMKNSIGMGDLKLLMVMAICQGLNGIMASGFCSMLVSFFAAVFLLITRKKTRKDVIPFAPCILIGTLVGIILTGA